MVPCVGLLGDNMGGVERSEVFELETRCFVDSGYHVFEGAPGAGGYTVGIIYA